MEYVHIQSYLFTYIRIEEPSETLKLLLHCVTLCGFIQFWSWLA